MKNLNSILGSLGVSQSPVSEKLIDKAEIALSVRFPNNLKEFLRYADSISFGAEEFFGVGERNPKFLDLVFINQEEQKKSGLSLNLIAIRNDGGGRLTCVDLATASILEFDADTKKTTFFAATLEDALLEIADYG